MAAPTTGFAIKMFSSPIALHFPVSAAEFSSVTSVTNKGESSQLRGFMNHEHLEQRVS